MTCEPDRCSRGSAEWTSDSPEPGSNTPSSPKPTPTDETCCEHDGPECRCTTTWHGWDDYNQQTVENLSGTLRVEEPYRLIVTVVVTALTLATAALAAQPDQFKGHRRGDQAWQWQYERWMPAHKRGVPRDVEWLRAEDTAC